MRVEHEGFDYLIAVPYGAIREIMEVSPYFGRLVQTLARDEDASYREAELIAGIALRWGPSEETAETAFDRHGAGVWRVLALEALMAAFRIAPDVPQRGQKKSADATT